MATNNPSSTRPVSKYAAIDALFNKRPDSAADTRPLDYSPSTTDSSSLPTDDERIDYFAAFRPTKHNAPLVIPDIDADLRLCSVFNERSIGLRNDFESRQNFQQMPPEGVDIFASTELPIYRRPPPPAPSPSNDFYNTTATDLNPHAARFIPTKPYVPPSPFPAGERWFNVFWSGAEATVARDHGLWAAKLVACREWDTQAIIELVQHFCWRGTEYDQSRSGRVASFARHVYSEFLEKMGEWYSSCFMWHLRECVVTTFRLCWKPDEPQSITFKPTETYVTAATCLAAFIGDLYTQNMVPAHVPHRALTLLLAGLTTVEHMHAIHELLLHANQRLWTQLPDRNAAVQDFVASFRQRTSTFDAGSTLMGQQIDVSKVQIWVKEVVAMMHRWQRSTQLDSMQ
ncbi:hypothetical protein PLICRDRAFT_174400 [Plicaturopsis crispa FD-325 SS-3]|nr:hypothetical protein PLICRDRAFT_174400 [Plicaturopsis crispa FD-325 SS-3]